MASWLHALLLKAEQYIVGHDKAGQKLGIGSLWFLALYGLFTLGVGLSTIFVNVYFWRISAELRQIATYNVAQFISLPIAFTLAGFLSNKRTDRLFSLRIGTVLHILFFGMILWLQDTAVDYLVPLGLLLGIGAGFFYLAINVLIYDLTDNTSVDRFNGLVGFVVGIGNMLAPFVAGYITGALPDLLGYYLIFGGSVALFAVVFWISTKLWSRPLAKQYHLIQTLKTPNYWRIMLASFLMGLRTGAFVFLIGLLVFFETNEFVLGVFSLGMAGVNLLSSYLGGRFIDKSNRNVWIITSGLLLTLAPVFLSFHIALWTLVGFGLLESLAIPWYNIPFQARTFRLIDKTPGGKRRRVEFLVSREIPLNVGKVVSIIGLIILLHGGYSETAVRYFMMGISPLGVLMGLSILHVSH